MSCARNKNSTNDICFLPSLMTFRTGAIKYTFVMGPAGVRELAEEPEMGLDAEVLGLNAVIV